MTDEQQGAVPLQKLIEDLEREEPGTQAKIEAIARSYQPWIVACPANFEAVPQAVKEKVLSVPRARILDEMGWAMLVRGDGDLLREALKDLPDVRLLPQRTYRPQSMQRRTGLNL